MPESWGTNTRVPVVGRSKAKLVSSPPRASSGIGAAISSRFEWPDGPKNPTCVRPNGTSSKSPSSVSMLAEIATASPSSVTGSSSRRAPSGRRSPCSDTDERGCSLRASRSRPVAEKSSRQRSFPSAADGRPRIVVPNWPPPEASPRMRVTG